MRGACDSLKLMFVNIYMNEFDQFIKRKLKMKYYIRYADDFIILNSSKRTLIGLLPAIQDFLDEKLKLSLHPSKIFLKTSVSGVDFLGWVQFPFRRVLSMKMFRHFFNGRYGNILGQIKIKAALDFPKRDG